jgi:hypothetical protein
MKPMQKKRLIASVLDVADVGRPERLHELERLPGKEAGIPRQDIRK